jgi:hypothetical protein
LRFAGNTLDGNWPDRHNESVATEDLAQLNLDVYDTRRGLWNPEHDDIEVPDGWGFLPAGDTFVTRTVQASGTYWVKWRPRGKKGRRRLGVWAPVEVIAQARAKAAETEEERARRRLQGARSRERQEDRYRKEFADAVREFLRFAPEHAELADRIAEATALHAAEVGSGRVGRTRTIEMTERATLAARAYIRHHHTTYEDELWNQASNGIWDDEFLYRQVKREAQNAVDRFLEQHRESPEQPPGVPD